MTGIAVPTSSAEAKTRATEEASAVKNASVSEIHEVEQQIKRIEEKLRTEPKVEGWVLVGNAYIYLKRYNEAVTAYQNAYLLDDTRKDVRDKLKNALYRAGLGQSDR
jgi:cytochrome c-type biogenesis protein CcmH/NrfG